MSEKKQGAWAREYLESIADARRQLLAAHEMEMALRARAEHMSSAYDAHKVGMPKKPNDGADHSMDPVDELVDLQAEDGLAWARELLHDFDVAELRLRAELRGELAIGLMAVSLRYRHGLPRMQIARILAINKNVVTQSQTALIDYLNRIGPANFLRGEKRTEMMQP